MINTNDTQRLPYLAVGDIIAAKVVASKNYDKSAVTKVDKKKKTNCEAQICLIFPVDEVHGFADMIKCKNGCKYHVRCEGIIRLNDEEEPNNHECKKCKNFGTNETWLKGTLEEAHYIFTNEIHKINGALLETNMKLERLEEVETKVGDRQAKLKKTCKELNLNPAKYHGGDFEGKAIQQMLECVRDETFSLLDCISDNESLTGKFKRALTTLREVSDSLKMPIEHFDQKGISLVKEICEKWGQNWIKDFPHLNITPKPTTLYLCFLKLKKNTKTFHMFYKMEQKGESIHAELSGIKRRIWSVRNQEQRMWKYIEQYELKNHLDTSLIEPVKRVFRNKEK